nr:MAG: hypothetical protein [Bacteriophage sp.]
MSNLKDVIESIGQDIGEIRGKQSLLLTVEKAYSLFPTYDNFVTHVVEARAWMPDPFVLKSQLPTSEIADLKQKVEELERTISEIKQSIQK